MRRASWASTRFWSMVRGFWTASRIAFLVISWNTMRLTGTLGLRTSTRCQAMLSPSRSSSVASRSSSDSLRVLRSSATVERLRSVTT